MEGSRQSSLGLKGSEDFGRKKTACMKDEFAGPIDSLSSKLLDYFWNLLIGEAEENDLTSERGISVLRKDSSLADYSAAFPGRSSAAAGQGRDGVASFCQGTAESCSQTACSDDRYLSHFSCQMYQARV